MKAAQSRAEQSSLIKWNERDACAVQSANTEKFKSGNGLDGETITGRAFAEIKWNCKQRRH